MYVIMDLEVENKKAHTALIIDDESDICFLLSNILRNNNLDVQFVNSINEGKSYLKRNSPQLLFHETKCPESRLEAFV